jgi:hypothetical protein
MSGGEMTKIVLYGVPISSYTWSARLALGEWTGQMTTLELSDAQLGDDQGCAIIIQNESLGPILGAAVCPAATS